MDEASPVKATLVKLHQNYEDERFLKIMKGFMIILNVSMEYNFYSEINTLFSNYQYSEFSLTEKSGAKANKMPNHDKW